MRAEQKPGRRRAEPQSRLRRRRAARKQNAETQKAEASSKTAELAADAKRRAEADCKTEAVRKTEADRKAKRARRAEAERKTEPARRAVSGRKAERERKAVAPPQVETSRIPPVAPTPATRTRLTPPRRPRPEVTRSRAVLGWLARACWVAVLLAALAAVVVPWVPVTVPDFVPTAGAVAMTTLYTHGLAVRTGGRPLISGGLALGLSTAAVVSGSAVMLAGAAVCTAVVAAVLAVLATKPAARFPGVVRELVLATAVAAGGAFAVRAYQAEVSAERTGYLAIGLSLLGALALVFRLGAGLHGLGRRGFVMIVSGVALLTVTLAYTEALARWGS
ncbi:MAG: hypothetical protein ACRDPR_11465, partial [Nocardioidaceae bacterium]